MNLNTKEIIFKEKDKEMVHIFGLINLNIKVHGTITFKTVLYYILNNSFRVYTYGRMADHMKVSGRMVRCSVKENLRTRTVDHMKEIM